ncbi:MAG: helix-turn-helix transcriptional regulator [bacterium]|nr:helix-turn-helix transcriptional regulator [bacterium]
MVNKEDIKYVYDLVSKRIKLFRKYRGITQEQLAEKTTFSRGLIGNIESAKTTQTFSLAVLYSFARCLDIPLEMFVKEDISDYLNELGIEIPEEDSKV